MKSCGSFFSAVSVRAEYYQSGMMGVASGALES
jgi:hypothetical protein